MDSSFAGAVDHPWANEDIRQAKVFPVVNYQFVLLGLGKAVRVVS